MVSVKLNHLLFLRIFWYPSGIGIELFPELVSILVCVGIGIPLCTGIGIGYWSNTNWATQQKQHIIILQLSIQEPQPILCKSCSPPVCFIFPHQPWMASKDIPCCLLNAVEQKQILFYQGRDTRTWEEKQQLPFTLSKTIQPWNYHFCWTEG